MSLNELGSLIIDVNSNRLDTLFLNSAGVVRDYYTLKKVEPQTPLAIDSIALLGTNVIITFQAYANVNYTLETAATLGNWQTLYSLNAVPTNRTVTWIQPAIAAEQFYRLRSP